MDFRSQYKRYFKAMWKQTQNNKALNLKIKTNKKYEEQ